MMRHWLFFLLMASSLGAFAQETGPPAPGTPREAEVLTLDQAVRLALEHNRTLRNFQLTVDVDEHQIAASRTDRFPSINLYALASQLLSPVDFEFNKGSLGTLPSVGPVPATNVSIHTPLRPTFYSLSQISQPLSQQYKTGLNIQLAKLSKKLDEEKLRQQRQALAAEVKDDYYQLLQTQSALDASNENLKNLRELDRVTSDYVAQMTALKADSLAVKAQLAQEEYNNLTLADSIASQKEQLNDLFGRDVRTDFRVAPVDQAQPAEPDLEAARTRALAARPELRQSRIQIQQAEFNRRVTKSGYIPDVSLAFTNLSLADVQLLPTYVATAGVLIQWNVFDWGKRRHELAANSLQIEQAKNSLSEAESQVLVDVSAKFRKLREARLLLRAAQASSEAEKEKVRVLLDQYEQKASLLKDVLQEQSNLANARKQYDQASLSFWTAKADFERSIGEE